MPRPTVAAADVHRANDAPPAATGRPPAGSALTAQSFDAVVVGAGAAGLHCAGMAGQRGLRVLVIDHAAKVAEKVRISGGGRCNFTNLHTAPVHFVSANPHFCRSALARYTPQDFLALVQHHGIAWHEKHKGQLFCDRRSDEIIDMLLRECAQGGVTRWQPCEVRGVARVDGGFDLETAHGPVHTGQLVVATGGLSIPQIGASDFGFALARQFGHAVQPPRAGLVPLTFDPHTWAPYAGLSGVSLPVRIGCGAGKSRASFDEDLLFTHRGLSGPAALQISNYWQPGTAVQIDLLPHHDPRPDWTGLRAHPQRQWVTALGQLLPKRLAEVWTSIRAPLGQRVLQELREQDLRELMDALHRWELTPQGTEGWRKAEVTAGGVDTRELSSQSMQSLRVAGLYFIGEVVDVTGWLGGYNFQWAWASAAACAGALASAAHNA